MVETELEWMKQPKVKQVTSFQLPTIETLYLSNNIPLTVIQDERKEAFRLDIVFGGGQVDQDKLLQAGTTCRMLREGTSHYSSKELAEKFDFYGAWLEVSTYFLYSRITLYSLTRYAETTIPLVAELIRNANFPVHEFDIINSSNKAYSRVVGAKTNVKAQRTLLTALFGQRHVCGHFAKDRDYEALTTNDLKHFYQTFYKFSNCKMFFSGELSDTLSGLLEKSFGENEWGSVSFPMKRKLPEIQTTTTKRIYIDCPTSSQCSVRLGCFFMPRSNPDFLFASFFNTLLGGFFGSRLMTELREKRGLTYGIGSTVSMYPFDTLLLISSETSEEHINELIDGVYNEIRRLQEELVSEKELALVKNYYVSDLCRTYEEPFSFADYCINMTYFSLPYDCQRRAVEIVKCATPDSIREYSRKWLSESNFREVVAGKLSIKDNPTE